MQDLTSLVGEALGEVANRERYSIREIFGALLGLRKEELRERENPLARERSVFCSAFVRRLYASVGLDLAPGIADKHTTPEDIFRTMLPHTRYVLRRHESHGKAAEFRDKVRGKIKAPIERLKKRRQGR